MSEKNEPVIRVTSRPNLRVVLSPTGFEAYDDKRARIESLITAPSDQPTDG